MVYLDLLGVLTPLRGKGIGGLLLRWVMHSMMLEGHKGAIIAWVEHETVKFYSKVVNAYISDIFYPMIRNV